MSPLFVSHSNDPYDGEPPTPSPSASAGMAGKLRVLPSLHHNGLKSFAGPSAPPIVFANRRPISCPHVLPQAPPRRL